MNITKGDLVTRISNATKLTLVRGTQMSFVIATMFGVIVVQRSMAWIAFILLGMCRYLLSLVS